MKRRTFLTATSTIGIVGVASGATVVNSVYNNISSSLLLEEFNTPSKKVLDKFICDVTENAESLGLDSSIFKKIAMPVKIVSNNSVKGNHNIVYKNKSGKTVSINIEKGQERVCVK